MVSINKSLDITQKLQILSRDSQYDLACACAPRPDEHRRRSWEQKWIYPVSLPSGKTTFLFKTLLSNDCSNNCKYCPLRRTKDTRRVSLMPHELAKTFLTYFRQRKVSGLFLSSGVEADPDKTMSRINQTAAILRRSGFFGYIHLKIIPETSESAIRHSLDLATAVSLNVELPDEENFRNLASGKNYRKGIVESMENISRLRFNYAPSQRPKQTTQFIVGAGSETDIQIIKNSSVLYNNLKLNRIYFSAYQRGAGEPDIPGERSNVSNADLLTREHRLYQADWLLRKYGFQPEEIPFENNGNLSLECDPKEAWAKRNPQFFPVNINKAGRGNLLRVPGFGEISINRLMEFRRQRRITSLDVLGKIGKRLGKAQHYICF